MPFTQIVNGRPFTISPRNVGLKTMAKEARSRFNTPRVAPQATPNPKAANALRVRMASFDSMDASKKKGHTRPGSMKAK